ncbi:betaine-aldehyde dehydrogenase [Plasticicumulans lactativorans]|uniref:Betaine-aldehyde dehydrogenase n=1 Tax=Plasticicumulans lactativorans TaxID=1133106 RepID=A0A4R2LFM9_9GAMM|nr:aldehyde dehydrogenase family protein [Plasticicumulans lactativorans]TCO81737.1 betaine-aldehyde dehydrogenase [Plasticicumulans lactativorans]
MHTQLFIDGAWADAADGATLTVFNPATAAPLARVAAGGAADMARAVAAAKRAFRDFRHTDGRRRATWLRGFAAGLERRREELLALQMQNSGKPRTEAEIDLGDAIASFNYYAGLAEQLDARQNAPVALPAADFSAVTRLEPAGVVALIVPWNFPLVTSAWKLAPALAAGCCVVLKPSEFTPLVELAYGAIAAEIGLPAGVLNIVPGGPEAGAALTTDPAVAKVSFTGSNAVGARVMQAAAANCTAVGLELGGKSPIVVFDDVDLDAATRWIMDGIFWNAGQMCSATSRLLVQRTIAAPLLERLAAATRALAVGDPADAATRMGPLSTAAQYRKVLDTFARAAAEGLACVAGGHALPAAGSGWFVAPTIYAEVPTTSPLWREEIFGPVLCTRGFDTEAEALALANDSDFGLAATVLSADPARAQRVAEALEAGHVWINSSQVVFVETSWGGPKRSGIGRELGPWGLSAYLEVKSITRCRQGSAA